MRLYTAFVFLLLFTTQLALGEKPVKPPALQEILSADTADADLFLLYDYSAGYTKKITIAELDSRWGGSSGVSVSPPLTSTGGSSPVFSIQDAVANAFTKGAATFSANDFNSSSGNISIDYTNAQSASSGTKGFLTSANWNTFNAKESPLTFDLPISRTVNAISIANAAADGTTKGAAAFTASDFNATSGLIALDFTNAQKASASLHGFLSSTDWSTFNAKESPLTFNLPISRSVNAISIADAAADGATKGAASFVANDFNATSGNVGIDYTNGQAASASNKGFLTTTDWSTFNGKESVLSFSTPLNRTTNTITIANAAADGSTKGAASFAASDFDASSGNITIDYTNGQAASDSLKGFLTAADHAAFAALLVGSFTGHLENALVKAYVVDQYAEFAYTVNRITSKCTSGTIDFDLEIEGSDVTGCAGQQMASGEAVDTCTAANTVAVGNTFQINATAISAPIDCKFTIKYTR